MNEKMTYRSACVDIEAGYRAVRRIQAHAKTTVRPGVLGGIGSFGGVFELPVDKYRQPVLISGTDGVGTKLKVAFMTGEHRTVGIDLVAYCVNDIICQGAEPLFFLDYIAIGQLDVSTVDQIVEGIAEGCRQAHCALIGGETAEMPGFYGAGEYDIAGFTVGVAEKDRIIDGRRTKPGDVVVGIASTGLQSSGFSLVRKICFEKASLDVDDHIPELEASLGDVLLTPTGIYVAPILKLLETCDVKGIANISGGGLPENLPRACKDDVDVIIERGSWPKPAVFDWLQRIGQVDDDEMYRTFNMGIGMAVIVPADEADKARDVMKDWGWDAWVIGTLTSGKGALVIT